MCEIYGDHDTSYRTYYTASYYMDLSVTAH